MDVLDIGRVDTKKVDGVNKLDINSANVKKTDRVNASRIEKAKNLNIVA